MPTGETIMIATADRAMTPNDEALTRLWNILRVVGWAAIPVLMAIPAVAMRFTDEVNWTTTDFVFIVVLLGGAGLVLELVARLTRAPAIRFGAAFVVAIIVGLIWAEGAVGIFH